MGMQCPPTPGPGWKGWKPKGLVDAEFVAEDGHFVDEGDVDVAVGVFQEFGRLGFAGAFGGDDGVDEFAVEGGGGVGAGGGVAADDFGGVA
jgi:hypothetical protein